jgi:hypothetical protein
LLACIILWMVNGNQVFTVKLRDYPYR